ncbi:MAG: DUF362 domain-containing protein [Peptococcaceae bacterium]|nr:DUF362 domain-containing protein [Peptococcaceae bacterium]
MKSTVAVLKTSPQTVIEDYRKLMHLGGYREFLPPGRDTVIKLNLSWTKYFPACSSQPWQLEGVVRTLIEDGYKKETLLPVENKTVVTNPVKGAINNKWMPVLDRYGLGFTPLPEVEWVVFKPRAKLLVLDRIFPEGIVIPKMFLGRNVLHLPTVKTHGHSITTGAIKNSFGGLLKEVRHYCHKYMHETLVDLMLLQKEVHSGIFAVMDGTVAGDGAGPRTMVPRVKNYILASGDSVAIDAVAARMMGMDPMAVPYLRMCDEMGLGNARMENIEIAGEDIREVNFGFRAKRSFVIWGDQLIRKGILKPFEKILLHSPLVVWAPFASNVYHDFLWYPTVGRKRINAFARTGWGRLFEKY